MMRYMYFTYIDLEMYTVFVIQKGMNEMRIWRILAQVLILSGLSWLGRVIVEWLGVPIPGSLVGLGILLLLLFTHAVRLEWLEEGANFLLAEMLLFFIPAAVHVVDFGALLAQSGVRLLVVIICSTLTVMVGVGLVTEWICRWNMKTGGGTHGDVARGSLSRRDPAGLSRK